MIPAVSKSLDQLFIDWAVRRQLPRLSIHHRMAHLRVAEQRLQKDIPDAQLFAPLATAVPTPTAANPLRDGRLQTTRTAPPYVPAVAQMWGCDAEMAGLTSQWITRDEPRKLVILVSGWAMWPGVAASLWPLSRLDRAGFDVVLPGLPWMSRVPFPGRDPCANIVRLAQAVSGVLQLALWAHELGHSKVVLCGTSLGAHLVALAATLPGAVHAEACVLEKPMACLSDPIRLHAEAEPYWREHVAQRLDRVYRAVSPLERDPAITGGRVVVLGGVHDQVMPIERAQALADHFQVPLRPIKASHLVDLGRTRRLIEVLTQPDRNAGS